jgi:DNA polymerase-3 subunit epsilon
VTRLRRRGEPWRESSFAVLDFETTGLDHRRDHVISFGLVPVTRGRIELSGALYQVVRPPVPVSPESIRVHGIRPAELVDAPELVDVADPLVAALAERVLVAHAAGVELGFLEELYRGLRRRPPRRAIDVVNLAAELLARRGEPPLVSPRLASVAQRFGVPVARTHHALGDALVTAELFLVLATHLELVGIRYSRELLGARRPQFA